MNFSRSNYNIRCHDNLKNKLINLLGGKCINCGIDNIIILQFDHKYNDGKEDRDKFNSYAFHRYYLKNPLKAKEKLQLLCANCNILKEFIRNEIDRLERYNQIAF